MTIKSDSAVRPAALPWALIGAACLGSFAATSSGTTRAPFLLDMAHDLDVSMPMVANLVSLTSISWGVTSALGGWLSDVVGRRPLLVAALFTLALAVLAQALAGSFFWVAVWATVGGGCSGAFMGVVFAEVSGRVPDSQRGRALGWVMSGQSLTLVIGVPMAAAVGSLIGWRGWLVCVGGLAFAASLSLFAAVGRGTAGHMRGAVRPSLRTALFQTFLLSWFDFGLTNLLSVGKVRTLTVQVFTYVGEANAQLAAVASLLLLLPPALLLWANKRALLRKAE